MRAEARFPQVPQCKHRDQFAWHPPELRLLGVLGGKQLGISAQPWLCSAVSHCTFRLPPFPRCALSCSSPMSSLAAVPGEIRLLWRAGPWHTQPCRVHRGREVGAFCLKPQQKCSSSGCMGAASAQQGFLQLVGGSFSSQGFSLARSGDKAQPVPFGNTSPCPVPAAGCRLLAAQRLADLLYLPFMARCSFAIISAAWPRMGTAGRCQEAELTAPTRTSPRDVMLALGASLP